MANPYSAEVAKIKAENYRNSVGGQLAEVLDDISRQSGRGEMSTTVKGLSEFTIKALENEGYQVLPHLNHDGYSIIRWDNPTSVK